MTVTATTPDDRRRTIAACRAYLADDGKGLAALLDDVMPPLRDLDEDPAGYVIDELNTRPVRALVADLMSMVCFFAAGEAGTPAAADAVLAAWLPPIAPSETVE